MTKRFGKYRSRLKQKKGAGIVSNVASVADAVAKKIEPVVKTTKRKVEKVAAVAKKVTKKRQKIDPDFFHFPQKHAESALHPHLGKIVHGISDYGHEHLKSAAAHILQEPHDGPPVLHHNHVVKSAHRHFRTMMHSSKAELQRAVEKNPLFRDAVSDAMHVAQKGGAIHWKHEVGGSLDTVMKVANVAKQVGDPVTEAGKTKDSYDKVNLNDWSAKGVAKNTFHGYSGNFHAAATHMKAANIASLGTFSAALIPAAQGFSAVGDAFGKLGSTL